jgi:predicted HTH domain antitoxin
MNSSVSTSYSVQVDLPADAFAHHPWAPAEIAREMRALWLIEQVRERRMGYGKAAELAGIPKAQFVLMMGKHQVSPFDYDPGEIEDELAAAARVAGT